MSGAAAGTKRDMGEEPLVPTVSRVVTALRARGIPFALTGGCAIYARDGPASRHDVDMLVREQDVPEAVRTLVAAGMRAADAPEDWLAKAYDGEVLVDLIHRPNGRPVTDETLPAPRRCASVRCTRPSCPAPT